MDTIHKTMKCNINSQDNFISGQGSINIAGSNDNNHEKMVLEKSMGK